jgi:hypothetical protein
MPNWGIGDMMAQNIAFDQQMEQQAADFANQWYWDVQRYRAQTGYTGPIQSGFNASTLSAANQANMAAFDSYNQSWWNNTQTIDNTLTNYSNTAVLGNAHHSDPHSGQVYNLPYGPDQYWINNQGYHTGTSYQDPTPFGWTQLEQAW